MTRANESFREHKFAGKHNSVFFYIIADFTNYVNIQELTMATNPPKGAGRRGAIRGRSQVLNTKTGHYIKRDAVTGKFMDGKSDNKPFKGVRKESNDKHQ